MSKPVADQPTGGGRSAAVPAVRQFDVPRTYPPTWPDELRMAVLWPDRSWALPTATNVVWATSELHGWLTDQREYDGQHKPGWLSALADFEFSADQLGPGLRATLGGSLVAAVATAAALTADLTNSSANQLASLLPTRLVNDRQVIAQLAARWGEADVRNGAWSDLAATCRDDTTDYETLALRRDLFWELIRAGDYGPDQMSRLLAAVLSDSEFHLVEARLWLGDITEDDLTWPRRGGDAGLSDDEQLALCARLLTKQPAAGQHVVWVAFDRAGPGSTHLQVGPVSFWNPEWLRAVLEQGGPNLSHAPAELKDSNGFFTPDVLPAEREVRLARVDLGPGVFTDPVRLAGDQAEAVVALAAFPVGDARWRRLPGHLIAIDGRIRSIGTFSRTPSSEEVATGLYQDAMEAELGKLAPQLAGHLPITDTGLSEIIDAVHWWQQARRQLPLAAVLLHVRVLELIAQRANAKPWHQYVETFHRANWLRRTMVRAVGEVVDDCLWNYEKAAAPEDQLWLRELTRAVTTWQPGSGRALDLSSALESLPELVRIFPLHDGLGRRVRSVSRRLGSVDAVVQWHDDLGSEWPLTLKRLQRIRNALAHGGPIQDSVVATVHHFAAQLTAWSLSVALEGVLEGTGVVAAHQRYKEEADLWERTLASASDPVEALLGPK
jgi:ribosomal 50S subunit-associated protein YjgA (DUF615 family)